MNIRKYVIVFSVLVAVFVAVSVVSATHSWNGYHWARTSNPFTLKLGDNVSLAWDSYLATTASDWSISDVLDTVVDLGKTKPRTCKATTGRVEVCSEKYGFNGWLGVAQIWVNGEHITKGAVKVNDSYFNTATYNTPEWRNLVMCQEVGHTLGLDHQDEIFDNPNLGTCMDYTSDPSTNQHPNQHDYDELAEIYAHLDGFDTALFSVDGGGNGKPATVGQDIDLNDPSAWGKAVKQDARGNNSLYERNLGNGEKLFTFVIWAK
ncbi:MAG: hypothetical protein HYW79_04015 [Parcubacteria group bacterium]|nr:hypothetical protein [Parcubacteria group bacterium]